VKWDEEGIFRFLHKGDCDRRDTDKGHGAWWDMSRFLLYVENNYSR
jgi:hypothetical protein